MIQELDIPPEAAEDDFDPEEAARDIAKDKGVLFPYQALRHFQPCIRIGLSELESSAFGMENIDCGTPTMKPIPLVGRLMNNSSKPGWNIGDFFGGSGTTLMTAEQLGRRAFWPRGPSKNSAFAP